MKKVILLVVVIIIVIIVVVNWRSSGETEIALDGQSQTQEQGQEMTEETKQELAEAAVTGVDKETGKERVRSVRKLRIGPALEKCESQERKECMMVNGQALDGDIEGFDYEEGFLYEINAEAVPIEGEGVAPQNQKLQYFFVEELSKMTEKEAEEKEKADAEAEQAADEEALNADLEI